MCGKAAWARIASATSNENAPYAVPGVEQHAPVESFANAVLQGAAAVDQAHVAGRRAVRDDVAFR